MVNCLKSIKKTSPLSEWLDYIQNLSPISINLSLDRVQEIAIALKLIPFNIYNVLVGGTNGKGTTCCLLEKILLNNNITVGLYTSPHLLSYNERIRICGKKLPDEMHVQAISAVDEIRGNMSLTYFEFSTLSALYIFKQFKLDVVILEVGLGGRLDATNIIDPNISAITNIAIDHIEFLGSTRHKIAIEKSGIFRSNRPAVIGELNRPVILDKIVKYRESVLFARGQDWDFNFYRDKWFWINYNKYNKCLINLPIPIIPIENAALALSILYWMPFSISIKSICFGLRHAFLFGRFQIIHYKPLIILDVGHNLHAAIYVFTRLSSIIPEITGTIRIVIGMLKNKDIKSTVSYLSKFINVWYVVNLDTSLSAKIDQFFNYLVNCDVQYFENVSDAWKKVIFDANSNDCILVFGSFYTVSPIMKLIFKQDF